MMTLARCFTSPPYVRTESSSFSVQTTAAVFLHSWPHGGFTRRLRDFNALLGNLQFGTGTVYSANSSPIQLSIPKRRPVLTYHPVLTDVLTPFRRLASGRPGMNFTCTGC